MEGVLHLSLPVRDLPEALDFYVRVLGCDAGRRTEDWADVWFFGMQVTLQHRPEEVLPPELVGTRHFGVALSSVDLRALLTRLSPHTIDWVHPPTIDHAGTSKEQRKAKLRDPSGNVIELKSYADVSASLRPQP